MTALIHYWQNLNERERWLAAIGGGLVFIYLFYLFIYSPLSTAVQAKSKQLIEKQETLAWMEQVQQQSRNQKKGQVITNSKLLALLGNQLNSNSLQKFVYQLQQTGPGDIQLTYEQVPFNQFLLWLWSLSNNYTITLKQFSVERTDTSGIVKLMVIIAAKKF